jgi:hypothetical protein
MQRTCHICGGDLPEGNSTAFCPHCGTPQLTLSLDLQPVEAESAAEATTGTQPPPRVSPIDWKMAMRCAAAVAGIAAVLSVGALKIPVLTMASMLWVMSGSLVTLGLYQNRRPLAWMDARIGARIGVVVGLCLTVAISIPLSIAGLVARFALHAMGGFDTEMAAQFHHVLEQSTQQSGTPLPPGALALIQSPEFRAASVLFSCAFSVAVLLVISTLGGAFAGLLRQRRSAAA